MTIDSESQPYGNAGKASRNVLRFLPESISFLYSLSMDIVHVCIRIGHHRAGRLDPEYQQPCELERERCSIPGEIRHEGQLLEEWPLWVSVLFLNSLAKLVYLTRFLALRSVACSPISSSRKSRTWCDISVPDHVLSQCSQPDHLGGIDARQSTRRRRQI